MTDTSHWQIVTKAQVIKSELDKVKTKVDELINWYTTNQSGGLLSEGDAFTFLESYLSYQSAAATRTLSAAGDALSRLITWIKEISF